ncbi:MAG: VWA domain-containing protein [Bacteroidia bacterium]|nr:VWA domain-containing protein [Bacteroidia bacterium]
MKEKQHQVYNLIILDESGSMESIKNPTIRGFNELVQTIQEIERKFSDQKHFTSLVTFNSSGRKQVLWNMGTDKLKPLSNDTYQPGFGTPLYDAIGHSVIQLEKCFPRNITPNVLVTILTDGEENASHEFSGPQIKAMIEKLKKNSWTFTYIGANHDVEAAAQNISIGNSLSYSPDFNGVEKMFSKEMNARMNFCKVISSEKMGVPLDSNDNYFNDDAAEKDA